MARLPLAFFSVASLFVLAGMVWGAVMGGTENYLLAPAHAHLNLIGWASMGLMGTFYALSGKGGRLGWVNFALSTAGVVVLVPSLAVYLTGNRAAVPGVALGTLITIGGMGTFVFAVLSSWKAAQAPVAAAPAKKPTRKAAA